VKGVLQKLDRDYGEKVSAPESKSS